MTATTPASITHSSSQRRAAASAIPAASATAPSAQPEPRTVTTFASSSSHPIRISLEKSSAARSPPVAAGSPATIDQ